MFNYKMIALFILLTFIFAFNLVSAKNKDLPLLSKVIYLDPGHGGY